MNSGPKSAKRTKRLDQIQERFPARQINRFVCTKEVCPLSFCERLVLSFLLYRAKRNGKQIRISISRLAKLSGMHRDTISKSLRSLEKHNLVVKHKGKWSTKKLGRDQHPDWFGWRTRGRDIGDLAYHYFPQPAEKSLLSTIDALIYLADLFDSGKSDACLAGRFGVSRATVRNSRRKVSGLEYSPDWFADIKFKTKPPQPSSQTDFLRSLGEPIRFLAEKMLKADTPWSQEEIERFLRIAHEYRPTIDEFDNLIYTLIGQGERSFDNIMRGHQQRVGKTDCGIGLVLHKFGFVRSK